MLSKIRRKQNIDIISFINAMLKSHKRIEINKSSQLRLSMIVILNDRISFVIKKILRIKIEIEIK